MLAHNLEGFGAAHAGEPSGEGYGALERRTVQLTRDHDLGCSD
jgi:hypothetical protein